ncbi:MAG: hypothetical protein KBT12_09175 [Bacteroidales bacterium]|nr:hypothetical protein [Candidatus Physcousia equi]
MKEDLYSYDANTRAAVFTNGEVTKKDVEKVVNAHPETTCVDLTHADVTGLEVDDIMTLFAGKNTVVITNATDATASNVVVKDAEGHYNCAKLELTDKSDFAPGVAFDASQVAYSRSNTTGYNTVCLPFRVAASDFGEGTRVYKLTGTEIVDHTTRITFDEANGIIEAGTPCLVDGGSTESWNMALTAASIAKETLDMEGTPSDDTTRPRLCGAFLGKALGEGCYKLNATGEKFVKTTAASTIMPFRFYLSLGDASSETKECGMRLIDESGRETYISDVLCPSGKSDAFDLNGRRVVRVTMPGVYVVGGKKVVR